MLAGPKAGEAPDFFNQPGSQLGGEVEFFLLIGGAPARGQGGQKASQGAIGIDGDRICLLFQGENFQPGKLSLRVSVEVQPGFLAGIAVANGGVKCKQIDQGLIQSRSRGHLEAPAIHGGRRQAGQITSQHLPGAAGKPLDPAGLEAQQMTKNYSDCLLHQRTSLSVFYLFPQ